MIYAYTKNSLAPTFSRSVLSLAHAIDILFTLQVLQASRSLLILKSELQPPQNNLSRNNHSVTHHPGVLSFFQRSCFYTHIKLRVTISTNHRCHDMSRPHRSKALRISSSHNSDATLQSRPGTELQKSSLTLSNAHKHHVAVIDSLDHMKVASDFRWNHDNIM